MIGQEKLLQQFNNYTLDTLPHSIILIGDTGCGKHTLCNIIAQKFNLIVKYISDNIDYEIIEDVTSSIDPSIIIINGDKITLKEESALLKFIEEPPAHIFIFILCTSINSMIDTIINRCQVYHFEKYTKEILSQFITDNQNKELLLQIANTPGKVMSWGTMPLKEMLLLVNKIFDKICIADISNILVLTNQVKCTESAQTGFEFEPFVELLHYISRCRVVDNIKNSTQHYMITNEFYKNSKLPNFSKKQLFEHYLYLLKGVQ